MSLINDALKQARKAPPRNTPSALPPLQPMADERSPVAAWFWPALVIILIVAAIFFIGWAVARRTVSNIEAAPELNLTQHVAGVSLPLVTSNAAPPPLPVNPPEAPKLQGILYSATAPAAILDGKIVHPGDKFGEYRVKSITKYAVILIGPDKKEIQLGMSN